MMCHVGVFPELGDLAGNESGYHFRRMYISLERLVAAAYRHVPRYVATYAIYSHG